MKEYLYTLKTNLTHKIAKEKISNFMQKKINEALKVKYSDLADLLQSDLNNYLTILQELYSGAPLEKVEELFYEMDTVARDDFYVFCKIQTENHKPFFSDCMSIEDVKMKLIKNNFRFTEDFDGLNFTLTLRLENGFEKTLKSSYNNYKLSEIKDFCCEVLDESKIS